MARSAPWMCTRSPPAGGTRRRSAPCKLMPGAGGDPAWDGAKAQSSGRLAEQLQVASDARSLIRQAKARSGNAWMTRRPWSTSGERPGHPGPNRRPGRRDGRRPALPHGRAEPARSAAGRGPQLDVGALDAEVAPHWNGSRADGGIGPRLSLLLLGFLATEVVPLANRAAELGFDPTPVFAATSGICGCTPTPWSVPTFAGDGDARGRGPPLACQPHHPDTTKPRGSRRGLGADTQLPQVLDGLAA